MAHRDTDTEKWSDEWFQELSIQSKLFWLYLCDKCDQAGVWKENRKLAQFQIGCDIDFEKCLSDYGDRVIKMNDRWIIKSFIRFHYGKLTENHKMYKKVLSCLEQNNLGYSIDTLSIVYLEHGNTLSTTMDSLKDKDKDKDKDKNASIKDTVGVNMGGCRGVDRHLEFLTSGPIEWTPFEYQSGKQWMLMLSTEHNIDIDEMIEGAKGYKYYVEKIPIDSKFVKKPQNWLKNYDWKVDWFKQARNDMKQKPHYPVVGGGIYGYETI